jgi:uridylate kinase
MNYSRILLKLSGEALMGEQSGGIDAGRLHMYANEIRSLVEKKVQVGVVMGGGNIFRGVKGSEDGVDRIQGDYMGMLATVINNMALQAELEKMGIPTAHLSGIAIDPICERMSSRKAIKKLESGKVVLLSGGTSNPFFTTDTAAALRALEIRAEVILKGTRVDGIFDTDPEKNPKAVKFDQLTYNEAYERKLNIMDLTAFTLCHENSLPIIVFNMNVPGNLLKIISGEKIGTLVSK